MDFGIFDHVDRSDVALTEQFQQRIEYIQAAEKAIANPLLDEISLRGAKGVLINITAGKDLTLFEVDEAANRIRAEVDQDAYIIVGSAFDESLDGIMRVSVVATGIDAEVTIIMPILISASAIKISVTS